VIKVLQGVLLFWTMIVVLTPLQPPSLEYQLAEVLVNLEKLISSQCLGTCNCCLHQRCPAIGYLNPCLQQSV
jgi:hypothetical protein